MSNNPSAAQEPNESQAPLIQASSEGEAEDLYNLLHGERHWSDNPKHWAVSEEPK